MSILSDNIQKRRWALDMSQEELAHRVGYKGRASINKIECGDCDVPYGKLEKFAEALEISLPELMGFGGDGSAEVEKTNKLIILSGLTASGKSHMLRKMTETHDDIVMIKRYTTKVSPPSEDESSGTVFEADASEVKACDVRGFGYGVEYGCKSSDIDKVLTMKKSPIVVGGVPLTSTLRKMYQDSLSIFLVADPSLQESILIKQGRTRDEIEAKFEYQKKVLFEAYDKSLHDYVVINNYDSVSEEILNEVVVNGSSGMDIMGALNLRTLIA